MLAESSWYGFRLLWVQTDSLFETHKIDMASDSWASLGDLGTGQG